MTSSTKLLILKCGTTNLSYNSTREAQQRLLGEKIKKKISWKIHFAHYFFCRTFGRVQVNFKDGTGESREWVSRLKQSLIISRERESILHDFRCFCALTEHESACRSMPSAQIWASTMPCLRLPGKRRGLTYVSLHLACGTVFWNAD